MARVVFRQAAINDLRDIWIYTLEQWSELQADRYYGMLEMACAQLGKNPDLGKKYPAIHGTLRGFKAGKHIIFYQVITEQEIEIIRILHERMDLKNRLDT